MNDFAKWQNKRILIVDPSNSHANELSETFESVGLKVCGYARNGIECLQFLKEDKPDLISLDIVMPEMDGIECAKILSKTKPAIPFFFVTKMTQDTILYEALKSNFSNWFFLTKPLDINQLYIRLNKLFGAEDSETNIKQFTDSKDPRMQSSALPEIAISESKRKVS